MVIQTLSVSFVLERKSLCDFPEFDLVWSNKEVLLRERKMHTARHVASTHYAVLVGVPPHPGTWPGRGVGGRLNPFPGPGRGVPPSQVQTAGGTPFLVQAGGYPLPRSRSWTWEGGTPHLDPPIEVSTDKKLTTGPSLILRMGAVIKLNEDFGSYDRHLRFDEIDFFCKLQGENLLRTINFLYYNCR